jgi:maltokinase
MADHTLPDLTQLPQAALAEFVTTQPWFRSRVAESSTARVLEAVTVREETPCLALAIAEVAIEHGWSELYQLPLGLRRLEDGWQDGVIATLGGWTVYDALADPVLVGMLEALPLEGLVVGEGEIRVEFSPARGVEGAARPAGRLSLEVYRRLDAGTHPELELLRFLTDRRFPNVGALAGSYSYSSRLIDATLGVVQEHVPIELDGWSFALATMPSKPDRFLGRLRRLGEVVRSMHELLASDPNDPDFAPEEPSAEALALFEATLDEEITAVFGSLPDDEAFAPIAGRGEGVRDALRQLSRMTGAGRLIRLHGNLHLGNAGWTGSDWLLFDFAGEPGRTIAQRRRKQSPLRDVASMLRSFAYAASATLVESGTIPPVGWEETAREEFLAGYFAQADTAGVVPGGLAGAENLLSLFELDRAVHELGYEMRNRPEWAPIPVAAIRRLLELRAMLAA